MLLLLLPLGARGHGPAGEGTARHRAGPRSQPGGAPGPGRREKELGRGGEAGGKEGAGRESGAADELGRERSHRSRRPAAPREGAGRGAEETGGGARPGAAE